MAIDWLGNVSNNWFLAGNWNPATVPTAAGNVTINNAGAPNPATISSAGAVASRVDLGSAAGQSGTLNIDGGTLTAQRYRVGFFGTGTINVSNGGLLSASVYTTAADSAGSRGTITVSGTNSRLNTNQLFVAADANTIGQVTIQNGGSLTASQTAVGAVDALANGTLTVTNATANMGALTVGETGTGTFNLNGGSTATSSSATIGSLATGNGTANVSGSGTVWNTSGIVVGDLGAGALNLTAGATINSFGGATINDRALVSGPNSKWILNPSATTGLYSTIALGLGRTARPASLQIENGGQLTIQNAVTATTGSEAEFQIGRSASTSTVTVTGAGSALTTPYDMLVGYAANSVGTVTVSNGGTLNTGHTAIASGVGSTGSVTVTGANSVWNITDSNKTGGFQGLFLGIGGAAATLTISDGAAVNVNSTNRAISVGVASTINIGAAAANPAAAAGTLSANGIALQGSASTINFNHTSSNYLFAPSISGIGTVNFLAGKTILSGQNSYTGATNISSGATAQFNNVDPIGFITGNIANNGAMIVKLPSLFEKYSGIMSGNGTFEQAGTGTFALTNDNTYTGLTTVSNGTLNIGNGGTTGSVAGNIQNNSHLAFNRFDNFTFSNLISGTGDVLKDGLGTMTFTGANTYTGGTYVGKGTLQLGSSNRLASTGSMFVAAGATFDLAGFSQTVSDLAGPGTVALGAGSLTFGTGQNREFLGTVTGSGNFIKQGTGSFTMTGNNAAYIGATTVNNGLLTVNGNLSNSATTVNAGGTLGGTGTVGQTVVGGTIAPGNSIGTLNINGHYVQNAGSFYNVEVNAAGQSDLINVTGTAAINGGTVRVLAGAGSYSPTTLYTILTSSGGRTGSYDAVTSNFAFLTPFLTYDANNVYLKLSRNNIDFAAVGLTPNQIAAGGGVAALGVANPIVNAALTLTPEQARAAFDSVSGEIHPSLHSLMLDESALVRDAILGRQRQDFGQSSAGASAASFADEEDEALAYAKKNRKTKAGVKWPIKAPAPAIAPVYGAWVQAYGNWTKLNSDNNAATLRATNGGAIGGVDVTFNYNWRFGVATGGGRTDARVDARLSSGTIDTFHVAAYGGGRVGGIALRSGAAYSHHDISTTRTVAFPGFGDIATANYGAGTSQVFGEAAYDVIRSWVSAQAFANLAYVSVRSDSFTETGGPAALRVAQTTTSATYSTLGLRAQAPIPAIGPWAATARGSLAWQHAYDGSAPVMPMAFAASPAPFAIAGVPIAADALLVEAGLDALVQRNTVLALLYTGRIASDASAHAVRANLAVRF